MSKKADENWGMAWNLKALVDDCNTTDPVRIREAWEARGGYVSPEYLLGALMRLKKERESK
jgi:hypothetical protein